MNFFSKNQPSTIYESLGIDLSNLLDESFNLVSSDENSSKYEKICPKNKYMGVFAELSILCFNGTNHKNFIFTCRPFEFSRNVVPVIVEKIYSIYGKDDSGGGLYEREENIEFDEGYWMGRHWSDNKFPLACAIDYSDENGLMLTIWT